jgi:hypothetical protein
MLGVSRVLQMVVPPEIIRLSHNAFCGIGTMSENPGVGVQRPAARAASR